MIPGPVSGNVSTGYVAPSGGSSSWPDIIQRGSSVFGAAAKYYGGYLGAQNQYTAAQTEAAFMDAEAGLLDYNAHLARLEKAIVLRERDIEIDEYRDEVRRTMGKQRAFYGWGNIAVDDPTGTPAAVKVRSMFNAEYNQGIIIERGRIRAAQAESKSTLYEMKAASMRSSAVGVEAGGKTARAAGFAKMGTELLSDSGFLGNVV